MEQALAEDGYAYANKVGDEDKIVIRQRRVSFPYDANYSPTPLPRVAAVIYNFQRTKSKAVVDAIPDTGAEVTCLPMLLACRWTIARISNCFFFLTTGECPILLVARCAR
ncbi:MAG: hypothetical protein ACXWZE_08500 [Candidatus Binatia bacterium]